MEDPIVIVGMGCRLPGQIKSPSELWALLEESRSAQSDFPANRLKIDSWYHPDNHRPGAVSTRGGYFLSHDDEFRNFDGSFFGISPLEVASMDPQQRKLLEVVYESFESAGMNLKQIKGSNTACYVGNFTSDALQMQARDAEFGAPYTMTGGGLTILSNRVNYVFNLKGPSFTIDTACSSTMYALHLACQSIQSGDCEAAIVGGTNLIFGVEQQIGSVRLGVLSPTSICHTFDTMADGYARADSVGALYVKRLSSALADGNPIRAVIRSTAINSNGRSPGISHPSVSDQERVIRTAYSRAGLCFKDTGYFECHGTGTPVGDPLEISAIGNVFSKSHDPETPLLIGSVKPNLGHGEAASAIPALIKVVCSLEKAILPKTIGIQKINPNLNLCGGRLEIVRERREWPEASRAYRRASVNSFGYGGANAHAILDAADCYLAAWSEKRLRLRPISNNVEQKYNYMDSRQDEVMVESNTLLLNQTDQDVAHGSRNGVYQTAENFAKKRPTPEPSTINLTSRSNGASSQEDETSNSSSNLPISKTLNAHGEQKGSSGINSRGRSHLVVPFASHNTETLLKNISSIANASGDFLPKDLCFTLASRSGGLASRAFSTVTEYEDIKSVLAMEDRFQFGETSAQVPHLAFAFTGQGAQWPQMGLGLIEEYPVVCRTLESLDGVLMSLQNAPSWSIMETLRAPAASSRIHESLRSQTVCTALQIAMVNLLGSWGIWPTAVVGHSSGEIAAAYSAGYLTEAQAIIVAYQRGVAVTNQNRPGAMLAVGLGPDAARNWIEQISDLDIACYNSPHSSTLSGTVEAVNRISTLLSEHGVFNRKLITSGNAYHSWLMHPAADEYQSLLEASVFPDETQGDDVDVTMFSSVTGKVIRNSDLSLRYWRQNLESPVQFYHAAKEMLSVDTSLNHVIEIGPHSALAGLIKDINAELDFRTTPHYLSAIQRNSNNVENMLTLAGRLFLAGYDLDLNSVNDVNGAGCLAPLPPYQWSYEEPLWAESRLSTEFRFRDFPRHDLLGSRIPGTSKNATSWRNILRLDQIPWLRDHKIGQDTVFPAAGYVSMAIEAVSQCLGRDIEESSVYTLSNMHISVAMVLSEGDSTELVLNLSSDRYRKNTFGFNINTVIAGSWTEHARGSIRVDSVLSNGNFQWPVYKGSRGGVNRDSNDRRWYQQMASVGLVYGPAFRSLTDIRSDSQNSSASAYVLNSNADFDSKMQESTYIVHPTAIDGCLQLGILASHEGDPQKLVKAYIPVKLKTLSIKRAMLSTTQHTLCARGKGAQSGVRSIGISAALFDVDGLASMSLEADFVSLENAANNVPRSELLPQPYSRLVWKPDIDLLSQIQLRSLLQNSSVDSAYYFGELEKVSALAIRSSAVIIDHKVNRESLSTHLKSFFDWMQDRNQALSKDDTTFPAATLADMIAQMQSIVERIGNSVPEARMVFKITSRIAEIMTGRVGALEVMLEDDLMTKIYEHGFGQVGAYLQLQQVIDLIAHKEPRLRILELGAGTAGATKPMLAALGSQEAYPKYAEYIFTDVSTAFLSAAKEKLQGHKNLEFGILNIEQNPLDQGFKESSFDIVFASNVIHATSNVTTALENCRRLLSPNGRLILIETTKDRLVAGFMLGLLPGYWAGAADGRPNSPFLPSAMWHERFEQAGFSSGVEVVLNDYAEPNNSTALIMARKEVESYAIQALGASGQETEPMAWLIYSKIPHPLLVSIQSYLSQKNVPQRMCTFKEYLNEAPQGSRTIIGVELEGPMLANLTKLNMLKMKAYANKARTSVWLTNGGVMTGADPSLSLVFGLAKSIMTEQPSFNIASIDVDADLKDTAQYAEDIAEFEAKFHQDPTSEMETVLAYRDGVLHISRYLSDEGENARFQTQLRIKTEILPVSDNLEMSFQKIGQLNTMYLTAKKTSRPTWLGEREVLVNTEEMGFDHFFLDAIRGKVSSPFYGLSCVGTVKEVGSSVRSLQQGDHIICLYPNRFDTTFSVDEEACHILPANVDPRQAVSYLLPLVSAIHLIHVVCSVKTGTSLLIDCPGDILNTTLAQVAMLRGATVVAICATIGEQRLLEKGFPHATITTAENVASLGQVFDLVLSKTNSKDNLVHSYANMMRFGGQFVLLRQHSQEDVAGNMIDLMELGITMSMIDPVRAILSGAIAKGPTLSSAVDMLSHTTQPFEAEVYSMEHLVDAAAILSSDSLKSVTLSYEPGTRLPTRILPEALCFPGDASYLLVGCLGGLGRSLVVWMIESGARHFIFLSRSGADKPHASELLDELQELKIHCYPDLRYCVIRGDVSREEDVKRAITAATAPIKGVIQAAMVLKDAIFTSMTHEDFNRVVHPKVVGTHNLHSLLLDHDLDFFVMTSSVLGAIGAATQSNYSAANAYLDHMARHRHAMGLQATSIALGMIVDVGHVEEHPEVETALKRNGMYGISIAEYLQAMSVACRRRELEPTVAASSMWNYDAHARGYIATGMDPSRLSRAGGKSLWLRDTRLRHLVHSLDSRSASSQDTSTPTNDGAEQQMTQLTAAAAEGNHPGVTTLVNSMLRDQFSKLVLVPVKKLDGAKALSVYGMDSMISAEIRTWTWRELGVDVPFLRILDERFTLDALGGFIAEALLGKCGD